MVCPNCGSNEVSDDGNESACAQCGYLFEDGNIVAEVGFVELGDGTSTVSGQYVSERGTARFGSRIPGFSRQSREVTIDKARRRIQVVASQLSLGNSVVEAAHRFYKLALQHNFVQGRRTHHVVAACLYMACRKAGTPHMLIDFSDALQTNVYVLGRTFLQFCHLLNANLPLVDPSLYIQRFAARLEFEEKTHVVANTALRIVQRMKRDWIQTGRRPAGVCGASLFIAAKLHGFRRTPKEIIQVVRVCDVTLRKRLYEFEETASSMLTAEEFDTIDLDQEQDPPAYTSSKLKEDLKNKKKRKFSANEDSNSSSIDDIEKQFGEELEVDEDLLEKEIQETLQSKEFRQIEEEEAQEQSQISQIPIGSMPTPISIPLSNSLPLPLAVDSTVEKPPKTQGEEVAEDTLSDIEDAEIDSYIMTSKEVEWKTELWTEMNKDFLKKLEQKEKLRAEQEQKPKKPRKKREIKRIGPADSPAEAAAEMLKKKVSSKLNYSALEELFKEDNHLSDPKEDRLHKFSTAYEPTLEDEIGSNYSKLYNDYENYEE